MNAVTLNDDTNISFYFYLLSLTMSSIFNTLPVVCRSIEPKAEATATRARHCTAIGGASTACIPGMVARNLDTGAVEKTASSGLRRMFSKFI